MMTRRSRTVFDQLRTLDPLLDEPVLSTEQIAEAQSRLPAAEAESLPLMRSPRKSSRRWVAPLAAAAAVAAVVVGVFAATGHSSTPSVAPAAPAQIPPAYLALAEQSNPLSAGYSVDCAGVRVPVPMLAAPGGAENGNSESSAALRYFLAHNPWQGMLSLTGSNWRLLSQTPQQLVFGQRRGPIGMGPVVVLAKQGGAWTAVSGGGCGPVVPSPGTSGEIFDDVTVAGNTLNLLWTNGPNCGSGPAKLADVVDRVLVDESTTAVHILLITKPAPEAGPSRGFCSQVGIGVKQTVTLAAPLGHRTLIDDAAVPGQPVAVSH